MRGKGHDVGHGAGRGRCSGTGRSAQSGRGCGAGHGAGCGESHSTVHKRNCSARNERGRDRGTLREEEISLSESDIRVQLDVYSNL